MKHLFLLFALLLFSACGNPDHSAIQPDNNSIQVASEDVFAASKCPGISVDEPIPTTAQEDFDISEELSGGI